MNDHWDDLAEATERSKKGRRPKRSSLDKGIQAGMEIARPFLKTLNFAANTANFGLKAVSSIASPILGLIKGIDLSGSNDWGGVDFSWNEGDSYEDESGSDDDDYDDYQTDLDEDYSQDGYEEEGIRLGG